MRCGFLGVAFEVPLRQMLRSHKEVEANVRVQRAGTDELEVALQLAE